jgi:hypothetical protein
LIWPRCLSARYCSRMCCLSARRLSKNHGATCEATLQ